MITLKESSVINNINFLKKRLGKRVILSAVVKANAYGHGIEQMVPMLQRSGVNHFSVFSYCEALRVEASLMEPATIMIMGYIDPNEVVDAVERGFEFFVFNIVRLNAALDAALHLSKPARIHLEAETGMNRSGLDLEELKCAIETINGNADSFVVAGFCTHLAGAESVSNYLRIRKHMKKFNRYLTLLKESGIVPELRHVANSAASFVYPKTRLDLVRVGIMIYGFWSSTEVFIQYVGNRVNKRDPLKRILGWQSRVMSVKEIKTGEYVGYGISFFAQTEMRMALIPVGYSDGYNRSLSNKGRVLVRGHLCSVIGLVNMNMLMVDITEVPDAVPGDQVVIIGEQGEYEILVSAFSDISNKLNYEVLTQLNESIQRKIIT